MPTPNATMAGFNPWFVMPPLIVTVGHRRGGLRRSRVVRASTVTPPWARALQPDQVLRQFIREFLTDVSPPRTGRPASPPRASGFRRHGPSKALSQGRTRGLFGRLVWLMDVGRPAERLGGGVHTLKITSKKPRRHSPGVWSVDHVPSHPLTV